MAAGNDPTQDSKDISRICNIYHYEATEWKSKFDHQELGYKYLAGEQYSREKLDWYEAEKRPANTFNLIFPQFNHVLGNFYLNDQPEQVYAQPGGTPDIAMILRDMIDHIKIDNEFQKELARTVLAGLVGGSYIYPRFSSEKHIDGSVVIKNVDEFEVMYDSRAKEYFTDDGKYQIRSRWMTTEDILHWWPQHRTRLKEYLREKDDPNFFSTLGEFNMAQVRHRDFIDEDRGKYRIIEFHEKPWETTEVAVNGLTGNMHIMNLEGRKRDMFMRANPNMRIIEDEAQVKRITTIMPGLNFTLDEKKADIQDGTWDIINYHAYNYGIVTRDNFGIFKNAIGPQDDFNEARNRTLDIINKSANVGETYAPDAFMNADEMENYGSKPGMVRKLKDAHKNISQVYQRDDPPKFPFTDSKYAIDGMELLQKITGISDALRGQLQNKNQAASLFAQQVKQAEVALVPTYINLRLTKNRLFNKVILLIQKNFTSERYFLINNPKVKEPKDIFINVQHGNTILNDVTVGRYKAFTDEVDQNPTAKHLRFLQKTEIVNFIKDALGPAAVDYDWWLEESDLGDLTEVKARIRQVLAQAGIQSGQEEAFQVTGAVMDLASKKQALEEPGATAEVQEAQ